MRTGFLLYYSVSHLSFFAMWDHTGTAWDKEGIKIWNQALYVAVKKNL